jgi:hypothetical protein
MPMPSWYWRRVEGALGMRSVPADYRDLHCAFARGFSGLVVEAAAVPSSIVTEGEPREDSR